MSNNRDLEERTEKFAAAVRAFCRAIKKDELVIDDVKQLLRASGSVGANCIEANEGLSAKDTLMRFGICRKEVKESGYWIRILKPTVSGAQLETLRKLHNETEELRRIFSSIITKLK